MAVYPGKAIRELLIDSTGAGALISTRVFPGHVPQNRGYEQQDRIVYHTISGDPETHLQSASSLAHARIQLDIYSGSTSGQYEAVKNLAEQCILALHGLQNTTVAITGTTESMYVDYIHLENEQDDEDLPTNASDKRIRRVIQDYRIGYQRTVPTF